MEGTTKLTPYFLLYYAYLVPRKQQKLQAGSEFAAPFGGTSEFAALRLARPHARESEVPTKILYFLRLEMLILAVNAVVTCPKDKPGRSLAQQNAPVSRLFLFSNKKEDKRRERERKLARC